VTSAPEERTETFACNTTGKRTSYHRRHSTNYWTSKRIFGAALLATMRNFHQFEGKGRRRRRRRRRRFIYHSTI